VEEQFKPRILKSFGPVTQEQIPALITTNRTQEPEEKDQNLKTQTTPGTGHCSSRGERTGTGLDLSAAVASRNQSSARVRSKDNRPETNTGTQQLTKTYETGARGRTEQTAARYQNKAAGFPVVR
jgi:hypothetical protein